MPYALRWFPSSNKKNEDEALKHYRVLLDKLNVDEVSYLSLLYKLSWNSAEQFVYLIKPLMLMENRFAGPHSTQTLILTIPSACTGELFIAELLGSLTCLIVF